MKNSFRLALVMALASAHLFSGCGSSLVSSGLASTHKTATPVTVKGGGNLPSSVIAADPRTTAQTEATIRKVFPAMIDQALLAKSNRIDRKTLVITNISVFEKSDDLDVHYNV